MSDLGWEQFWVRSCPCALRAASWGLNLHKAEGTSPETIASVGQPIRPTCSAVKQQAAKADTRLKLSGCNLGNFSGKTKSNVRAPTIPYTLHALFARRTWGRGCQASSPAARSSSMRSPGLRKKDVLNQRWNAFLHQHSSQVIGWLDNA